MAKPGFSLHFAPTQIEVAKSKDMAYDVGTFELKLNDAQGAPMTIPGKYVVVWKKQQGGSWKAQDRHFKPTNRGRLNWHPRCKRARRPGEPWR